VVAVEAEAEVLRLLAVEQVELTEQMDRLTLAAAAAEP
jgi:hypothetical protein